MNLFVTAFPLSKSQTVETDRQPLAVETHSPSYRTAYTNAANDDRKSPSGTLPADAIFETEDEYFNFEIEDLYR